MTDDDRAGEPSFRDAVRRWARDNPDAPRLLARACGIGLLEAEAVVEALALLTPEGDRPVGA